MKFKVGDRVMIINGASSFMGSQFDGQIATITGEKPAATPTKPDYITGRVAAFEHVLYFHFESIRELTPLEELL